MSRTNIDVMLLMMEFRRASLFHDLFAAESEKLAREIGGAISRLLHCE
jgi:hypothetical protein